MNLDRLLSFVQLTQQFRTVSRSVLMLNPARRESDVEHSYQLAMVAWYIVSSEKLNLDLGRVIQYALAHDLVEIFAGDTPMESKDQAFVESKTAREKAAQEKIQSLFPEFAELHEAIHRFEERADKESHFVYALDKILPPLNIYLEKGHSWKANDIRLKTILEHKTSKVAGVPEVKGIFDDLVVRLKAEEGDLFNSLSSS